MASPTGKYVPRFISREELSPDMKLNSIIQKLSPSNFDALMTQARSIKIVPEPEGFPVDEEIKTMRPVIDVIMKNIKICNENDPQNGIYANMYVDLCKNWQGRQGAMFKTMMNEELERVFADYSKVDSIEVKHRLQMYSVISFVSKLYHLDGVSGLYIVKILETFCKEDDDVKIPIFAKLLYYTFDRLCKEPWFKGRLVNKYHTFLQNYVSGDNRTNIYFVMEEILAKKWPN